MLQNETLFGGYFSNTKTNSIMVNYYENDKYYKSHKDVSVITQLTWIYREPKMFSGGDLILTDMGETIECKNNRTIFFPGHYYHEVMEVKMEDEWETEYKDKNYYGRFSIANFFQN
jgi:Rps23 Pro-64 3,4-dihydroxylase Tpa1-like proline 4-hydroxylase